MGGGKTYRASVVGLVDARDSFAVIGTASNIGSRGGRADARSVSARGIARGRADVSCPATSRGNDLAQKASGRSHKQKKKQQQQGMWQRRKKKESVFTMSGSREGMRSLPRVSE
jgi:hypothetical protein